MTASTLQRARRLATRHAAGPSHSCDRRLMESLEARQLNTATPALGDGHDYVFLAANEDDPGATIQPQAIPAQVAPAPSTASFQWLDGTPSRQVSTASTSVGTLFSDNWGIWPRDAQNNLITQDYPDEHATRAMARYAATRGDTYVIDIENWPMDVRTSSRAAVDHSIAMFKQIIGWIRDEQPQLKIAIYDLMSLGDMYASGGLGAQQFAANGDPWWQAALPDYMNKFAAWQAANEYLRPLANAVDFIAPSLYTRVGDVDGEWSGFAKELLDDSHRFGKPVIPFVWANYHPCVGGTKGGQPLEPAEWQHELDLVRANADGAIVWTDSATYDTSTGWARQFIDDAEQDQPTVTAAPAPGAASYVLNAQSTTTTTTDPNDGVDAGDLLALAA